MWTETLGTIIYDSPFHVNKANKKKSKVLWSRVALEANPIKKGPDGPFFGYDGFKPVYLSEPWPWLLCAPKRRLRY